MKYWSSAFALLLVTLNTVTADDFLDEIRPIFESRCLSCHIGDEPEGGFSLASRESALKGGISGVSIVPGNADKSTLVDLISLPRDDDYRMPMEDDPLSKQQIQAIKAWINDGAPWPENIVLSPADERDATPRGSSVDLNTTAGLPITELERDAVRRAEELGGLAIRSVQDSNWLRVDFSLHGRGVRDSDLELLQHLDNLVELDLGGTKVTDAGMQHLGGLNQLRRLHLDGTAITDVALTTICKLPNLTYLNLYGTGITDQGIALLKDARNLRSLYLWQTEVSEAAAEELTRQFDVDNRIPDLRRKIEELEQELQRIRAVKMDEIRKVKRQIASIGPSISVGRDEQSSDREKLEADTTRSGE